MPATERADASVLGLPVLAGLVEAAADGIAVLDAERRYLYVNPAACRILGGTLSELTGQVAPFAAGTESGAEQRAEPSDAPTPVVLAVADGTTRQVECTSSTFGAGSARRILVVLRDLTQARRRHGRLTAFARTASSLVYADSLQDALDRVAVEVLAPTGAVACTLVLVDPETHGFRMVGTSGLGDDYLERLEECRRLGAPLATAEAFESRAPVVRRDVQELVSGDPRYAPMESIVHDQAWGSAVAVPLFARDEELGVLMAAYPAGDDPDEDDVDFLTAVADQAAVAVDNARLLAQVEGKVALEERHRLARELHDSVSQALFSMNLQARAVELAALEAGSDPEGKVVAGLGELLALSQGALAEMRALIFQLRPEALHEEGLVAAVRKHVAAVAAREGLDLSVQATPDRLTMAELAEEELFRVVQEAVHNCVKHGHAEHVDVRLTEEPADSGTLIVEVADDGVGFAPTAPHPGHLGLDTMRERTERLGGRLTIDSSDAGSTVRAVLPAILRPVPGALSADAAHGGTREPDKVIRPARDG